MRYLVTDRPEAYENLLGEDLVFGTIDEFLNWISFTSWFQLDSETTMVKDSPNSIQERELLLIQIGSIDKEVQWLIEWTVFRYDYWKKALKILFEDTNNAFIIHNARFDYVVIKQALDIRVENVHDTFLMSKILNMGLELPPGYHSLAGCLARFFNIKMNKEEQTSFTKDVMTLNQIDYATIDVLYMYDLFLHLKELLESWNLWYVYDQVEREVVKAFGDMDMNSMQFDKEYWGKLTKELQAEDVKLEAELNQEILADPKLVYYLKNSKHIIGTNLIQTENQITLNWGSNVDRKSALLLLIPELSSVSMFTKPTLKSFLKSQTATFRESVQGRLLHHYMERNYDILNRYLVQYHKAWLLSNDYYIPAGTININWASNVHKLFIFQFYYPNLKNTDATALKRIYTNSLINKFKKYSGVHKNVTTYGEGFVENYVREDSTISPSGLNQILSTGRVAYGILLQLPGQARFRNAFLPPYKDWVFVDSDYALKNK